MIYAITIQAPGSRKTLEVRYAATDAAAALATAQTLGHALGKVSPTLVAGPRMCCRTTAQLLGAKDALGGPDNFDPLLLPDGDYRMGYRRARIAAVGVGGLSARENHETLF
jgi:hypothetical protein